MKVVLGHLICVVRRCVCLCAVAPGCPARPVWEGRGFLISFLISKDLSGNVASCYVEVSSNGSGLSGRRRLHQGLLHSRVGMSGKERGEGVFCMHEQSVDKGEHAPEALSHSKCPSNPSRHDGRKAG